MKYLAGAFLGLACLAAQAVPPPNPDHPSELRKALGQYHPASSVAPPRQLTPAERAELRRQLSETPKPAPRR